MLRYLVMLLLAGSLGPTAGASGFPECFIPGETVEYRIYWLGIPIAWSRTTTDTVVEGGRELIRITMISRSYAPYRHIYEVNDRTEVLIDPETALPVRHDWVINEGSVHKSQLTTYNHKTKTAIFQDRISKDILAIPIEEDTQEIFSFIYANRTTDIRELAKKKHRLLVTGKLYDLGLRIVDKGTVKLSEYGRVAGLEIEPEAEFDGLFLRKGKIFFWISSAEPRMVTCIKADVAVGAITAKLQSVDGIKEGFWSNRK